MEGDVRHQTSDFRLAVCLATSPLLTTGTLVQGDFSTALEMTGRFVVPPLAGERWYAVPKGDGIDLRIEI